MASCGRVFAGTQRGEIGEGGNERRAEAGIGSSWRKGRRDIGDQPS